MRGGPDESQNSAASHGKPYLNNLADFVENVKRIENKSNNGPHIGNKIEIPGADSKEMARYEFREFEDVIPSHDPENTFKKHADYPEIAQERPYHSDDGEQQKVVGNAFGYEPGFVISTGRQSLPTRSLCLAPIPAP